MNKKNYHNLDDDERDRLNLPPTGFQGEEFTVILQAPNSKALQLKVDQFRQFAKQEHYDTFEVLQQGRDPDGGFKAIISAHNWNPITWAAEKGHRAYLGVRHGFSVGKQKAVIKHQVGVAAELAQAAEEEADVARRRLATRRAVTAERLISEPALAAARTHVQYAATPSKDVFDDLTESIFGRGAVL